MLLNTQYTNLKTKIMAEDPERSHKQSLLVEEIVNAGYDTEKFAAFCEEKKPDGKEDPPVLQPSLTNRLRN